MIKFYSLLHLLLNNDRGHHITQTESLCFGRFSVIEFHVANIKVQAKLIHFHVGFGLGLDIFDRL